MVAKSYQNLEQIGEPYTSNNKQYVKVRTTTGSTKIVRWYTEAEYRRMYPNETETATIINYNQKSALGFSQGNITIFKGNAYEDREWFKLSSARYSRYWGWYFVSEEKVPEDLPKDVTPISLAWETVSNNDRLLPEDKIKKIIEDLVYEPTSSIFVGEVGKRYQFKLHIDKVITTESAYGPSNIHTMSDEQGNIFVWATTAKKLEVDKWYEMAGTVKEHKVYHNSKQTWLTRCMSITEVK